MMNKVILGFREMHTEEMFVAEAGWWKAGRRVVAFV
jgi:hypothetical protein